MPDAVCLTCLDRRQLLAIIVYQLCQLTNMACDPATLMASAKCFQCADEGQSLAMIVYLLCKIQEGGGVGGGGVLCGAGDPAVDPGSNCSLYYDTVSAALWYWDDGTSAWLLLIGGP